MIKKYRQRFIIYNMFLSGIVLLAVFIVLGVVNCKQEYRSLENTMGLVLKPWNTHQSSTEKNAPEIPKAKPEEIPRKESSGEPDRKKPPESHPEEKNNISPGNDISHDDYDLFTTVIYYPKTDEFSFLSIADSENEETVIEAVYRISDNHKHFGKVQSYGLMYYKENTRDEIKIAFVDSSYLTSRIAGRILLLTLVFVLSLGAIFAVSLRLAKLASAPMEQAIEMERNFVADISHDLKTPITIVLANNGIIKSNPDEKVRDQIQWIDSTEEAAKNMMTLVNEMLTLSEIESVGKSVDKCEVSLSAVCEKCLLQLESLAYEQKTEIISEITEDVCITSTKEYTERICSGLIENALKYEPVGGRIEVKVFKHNKNAVLQVKNYGSIINADELPHIFERFYRADKTRGKTKGHGLGLPIIKQMTELVGGRIDVKSSQGEGTEFTVWFDI